MFPVDAAFHEPVGRLEEIVAVKLGVEAEDGRAEQPVDDLFAPRADAEGLRIRPRNMPEGDKGRFGQPSSHHAWEKREVVILYQDNGIVLRGFLYHRIGEALIHGDIMLPVAVAKNRPDEGDVA